MSNVEKSPLLRDSVKLALKLGDGDMHRIIRDGASYDDLPRLEALHILLQTARKTQTALSSVVIANIPSHVPGRMSKKDRTVDLATQFVRAEEINTTGGTTLYHQGSLVLDNGGPLVSVQEIDAPLLSGHQPQTERPSRKFSTASRQGERDEDTAPSPALQSTFRDQSAIDIDRTAPIIIELEQHGIRAMVTIGATNPDRKAEGRYNLITVPDYDTQIIVPIAPNPEDSSYRQLRGVLVMKGIKDLDFFKSSTLNYSTLRAHDDVWATERFTSDNPQAWARKLINLAKRTREGMPDQKRKKRFMGWQQQGKAIWDLMWTMSEREIEQVSDRTQTIAESFKNWGLTLPESASPIADKTWNALNVALHHHANGEEHRRIRGLPERKVTIGRDGQPAAVSSLTYALQWVTQERELGRADLNEHFDR